MLEPSQKIESNAAQAQGIESLGRLRAPSYGWHELSLLAHSKDEPHMARAANKALVSAWDNRQAYPAGYLMVWVRTHIFAMSRKTYAEHLGVDQDSIARAEQSASRPNRHLLHLIVNDWKNAISNCNDEAGKKILLKATNDLLRRLTQKHQVTPFSFLLRWRLEFGDEVFFQKTGYTQPQINDRSVGTTPIHFGELVQKAKLLEVVDKQLDINQILEDDTLHEAFLACLRQHESKQRPRGCAKLHMILEVLGLNLKTALEKSFKLPRNVATAVVDFQTLSWEDVAPLLSALKQQYSLNERTIQTLQEDWQQDSITHPEIALRHTLRQRIEAQSLNLNEIANAISPDNDPNAKKYLSLYFEGKDFPYAIPVAGLCYLAAQNENEAQAYIEQAKKEEYAKRKREGSSLLDDCYLQRYVWGIPRETLATLCSLEVAVLVAIEQGGNVSDKSYSLIREKLSILSQQHLRHTLTKWLSLRQHRKISGYLTAIADNQPDKHKYHSLLAISADNYYDYQYGQRIPRFSLLSKAFHIDQRPVWPIHKMQWQDEFCSHLLKKATPAHQRMLRLLLSEQHASTNSFIGTSFSSNSSTWRDRFSRYFAKADALDEKTRAQLLEALGVRAHTAKALFIDCVDQNADMEKAADAFFKQLSLKGLREEQSHLTRLLLLPALKRKELCTDKGLHTLSLGELKARKFSDPRLIQESDTPHPLSETLAAEEALTELLLQMPGITKEEFHKAADRLLAQLIGTYSARQDFLQNPFLSFLKPSDARLAAELRKIEDTNFLKEPDFSTQGLSLHTRLLDETIPGIKLLHDLSQALSAVGAHHNCGLDAISIMAKHCRENSKDTETQALLAFIAEEVIPHLNLKKAAAIDIKKHIQRLYLPTQAAPSACQDRLSLLVTHSIRYLGTDTPQKTISLNEKISVSEMIGRIVLFVEKALRCSLSASEA